MSRLRRLPDPAWALLLGLLALAGGLLVQSGRFHSVDEAAMFTAARNLVVEGSPHTNQMGYSLWALRPGEAVNSLAANGSLYTKKSPVMLVLLAPLVWLARLAGGEGVRAALWLGPLLLAGTAVLFFLLARQLHYRRGPAAAATLIFAFATLALPYSQTIFGEQAAMFGLLLALWAAVFFRVTPHVTRAAFICGVGVALAVGVNAVYAAAALLFALFLAFVARVDTVKGYRQAAAVLVWFALPVALLGAGLLAYNQARFGSWLATGYNFAPGQEGFTTPLWWGAAGLLFSPARGLLWYSAPVILGLVGLPQFFRRERPLSLLMLAVVGVQVAAFGLWWEWWGGYGWGPRFLLPVVPYLMIFALPVLAAVFSADAGRVRLVARVVVVAAVVAGVWAQIAGAAVDANRYEQWLDADFPAPAEVPLRYHHDPALVYDVSASPIFNHWRQIVAGDADDLSWLRPDPPPVMADIIAVIQQGQQPGERLIFTAPELLYEVLDADLPPAYGLPYNVDAADALAQRLFMAATDRADRLWLVTQYAPGDPANWYEADLRREWASVRDEWLGAYRLVLLARPPSDPALVPADVTFGDIQLAEYGLEQPGDTLFVTVRWTANAPLPLDYVNFVQVFDENGRLLAQQDRPPHAGYKPTSAWQVGEPIEDRYAFPLAPETAVAQIRLGWYTWPELERLPVTAHDGHETAENSLILYP